MALIVCPECGQNFSDRAPACPECGCPTSEIIGQSSKVSEGQIIIANNAFDDGRYDEAYQIYSQAYSAKQTDTFVMYRLALVTGAKDMFAYGIPNSTRELIKSAIRREKERASDLEQFCEKVSLFLNDADSVISNVTVTVADGAMKLLQQTETTRSAGEMVTDALFSPIVSANRNLYEDRKTLNRNLQIANTANQSIDDVKQTLKTFRSFILHTVADSFAENEKANTTLAEKLNDFVVDSTDNDLLKNIVESDDVTTYGLCYGEETEIHVEKNVIAFYYIGTQVQNQFFLSTPVGDLRMTNYKIEFKSAKAKCSFELPLQKLSSIGVGGVGNSFVELKFTDGKRVLLASNINATLLAALLINQLGM